MLYTPHHQRLSDPAIERSKKDHVTSLLLLDGTVFRVHHGRRPLSVSVPDFGICPLQDHTT